MDATEKLYTAFCPGCSTKIRFTKDVEVGQFVVCAECGDELEVVKVNPVKLDWAFVDSFDEYDDDDEFEDDFDEDDEFDYDDED